MADTPKRVIRLIDNIKLELYEGRKKYVQIWDPIGNNTYNEDDKGPSGVKSPEKSKNFQSAEDDNNVIHFAIENSQIVEYYRLKAKRTNQGKKEDIKPYFTYLQDPFSETPPPKRIYGGGGLGTPEVDNVGPTPYYLNNGCKVNIKWTGRIPNPKFIVGTFSTPDEAEDYNQSLNPEGPPRWLFNQPILSDMDETDSTENPTLRPQSEWILKTYYNPGNNATPGKTYSNYRDKPYVNDKFVTITLPTGFTENGGKGYLEYIGSGYGWGKSLVYSTEPKGDPTSNGKIPSVLDNFNDYYEDKNILESVITGYKMCVSEVYKIADFTDYPLKVCFPDTGTCSPIPYKSPIVNLSEVGSTPSVAGALPLLTPKKVKLNVFGLPGVTSLSGETDGSIKVKVKVSLPDFTVYLGDPPGSTVSNPSGLNPFGLVDDEVENPDPYEETVYSGPEEEAVIIDGERLILFSNSELKRDDSAPSADGSGSGVNFGGSNVNTPSGNVSNSTVELPADLKAVQNSSVITKQSMGSGIFRAIDSDITTPSGAKSLGKDITKCMNEFISDVLSPFSTFLKSKYPALYKIWYITSATRGYVPSGGSLTSQHMKGQAIDSQILGASAGKPDKNIDLMNAILEWYKLNPVGYGQILFETRDSSCWIHWSYTRGVGKLMFARFAQDSTKSAPANKTGSYVLPTLTRASLGF
jgi:hypothetical protein